MQKYMEVNAIKKIPVLLLFLLLSTINFACADNDVDYDAYKEKWDLLYENKSDWLCFDYSVDYARNHPGWGMVIMSPSPAFRFQPHMANYMIEGNTLYIHEPQANRTYELEIVNGSMTVPFYEDFPDDFSSQWTRPTYFHFIPDESGVLRTYYSLNDNRAEFFDYENMSKTDASVNTTILNSVEDSDVYLCENSTINQELKNSSDIGNKTATINEVNKNVSGISNIDEISKSRSITEKIAYFLKSLFGT
ncbi:hypothetical protein [Methanolobus sp.]|jgi:hypothetical protein|uniref:hypothetical protein n=1 Tax=Methanolobus sp. TaxID=1874737 RepID=UPI00258C8E5E|nr:hypothetical protein [Methanolobus sp.]